MDEDREIVDRRNIEPTWKRAIGFFRSLGGNLLQRTSVASATEAASGTNGEIPKAKVKKKAVIVGCEQVGKSKLLLRFSSTEPFDADYLPTIGVDFNSRVVSDIDGSEVKLELWDTSGHTRFRSIRHSYYRNMFAAMVVYSITDRRSFELVPTFVADLLKVTPRLCLVGNKSDLHSERVVSTEEGMGFADEHKMHFFETSVKDNVGIEDAFMGLLREPSEGGMAMMTKFAGKLS